MIKFFQKNLWRNLPNKYRVLIHNLIPKTLKRSLKRAIISNLSDAIIISFPKCGRTWLRIIIGNVLKNHYKLESNEIIEIHRLADENYNVPRIYFSHDDNPHKKNPEDLDSNKKQYNNKKVIFLVRDPRDVLVSIFHHKRYRTNDFSGNLKDYLNQEIGSINSIIKYYNIWQNNSKNIKDFIVITYENLHNDSLNEIKKIMSFLEINYVNDDIIKNAIKFASFDNMRKMELSGVAKNDKLTSDINKGESSYKTRSGKIGEYNKYFNEEELDSINKIISEDLSDEFNYYKY